MLDGFTALLLADMTALPTSLLNMFPSPSLYSRATAAPALPALDAPCLTEHPAEIDVPGCTLYLDVLDRYEVPVYPRNLPDNTPAIGFSPE